MLQDQNWDQRGGKMDAVQIVRVAILPTGLMDRRNAAAALGRTAKTLSAWARLKIGPTPINVGGRIFYRWSEVQAFMSAEASAG